MIVRTSVALPVLQRPAPLVAVIVTLYVPSVVGVPEMTFRFGPLPCDKPGAGGFGDTL
jgi:hypothetical protein